MNTVQLLVPASIDDPRRPSGGNVYDRCLARALSQHGWRVIEHALPGDWPWPAAAAREAVATTLARFPDDSVLLLDGMIASTVPELLRPQATRLRLLVLMHMPLGVRQPPERIADVRAREGAALSAAAAVIATSSWTRDWLLANYPLAANRVHIAEPAVERAELVPGSAAGGALMCVAAVTRAKGYDVLLAALRASRELRWQCLCVGALDQDPAFAEGLRRAAAAGRIADRLHFVGTRSRTGLAADYAAADLVLVPSRAETYGMVVTESLARGIPVIASAVGGLPAALGHDSDRTRPGLLVPAGDPAALGAALRCWLGDASLRTRLRRAAAGRRMRLADWTVPSARIGDLLTRVAP